MRRTWSLWMAPVILVSALAMQREVRPVPLKIGDRIPAFRAVDQHGKQRRFGDLVGATGLVLFFHKSADW